MISTSYPHRLRSAHNPRFSVRIASEPQPSSAKKPSSKPRAVQLEMSQTPVRAALENRTMEGLRDKIHRAIVRVLTRNPERLRQGYEEHIGIAEAMIRGAPQAAERMIRKHLESGKAILLLPRES
jgi:DNA-binding GntR family transcriptional regulator